MMLAAKHFDPIIGIDVHIIQPPGPVPPVPIPHPFIGIVIDPFDYVPILGATVMVNGIPRGQAGTAGKCIPPHIPIGGTFIKPPGNEAEIFMGSATVAVDGDAFSHLALPCLTCQDVGMPPPPRAKKKSKTKSLVLPTSVVLPIPAGPPVLVGGPPTISLMAMGMKAGMAGLGSLGRGLRRLQRGAGRMGRAMRRVSSRVHSAARRAMGRLGVPPSLRNRVHRAICSVTGHPVDVATGKVFTDAVDFEIAGPLPLKLGRVWYSCSTYNGPLGYGWHHSYDLALSKEGDSIAVRLEDGRAVTFPNMEGGESCFNRKERLTLHNHGQYYILEDTDGLKFRFEPRGTNGIQPLIEQQNRSGDSIHFYYSATGALSSICDSCGRRYKVQSDDENRIVGIMVAHTYDEHSTTTLARYRYDETGNLVEAFDALAYSSKFHYDNRLLINETDKNGIGFYFEYDGQDTDARCTRTWGDGGIYDHSLKYDDILQTTEVTNSLGHITTYHWDDNGLITRTVDPHGNFSQTTYDEFCKPLVVLDKLGLSTAYTYDERGNRVHMVTQDGAELKVVYNEMDLPMNTVDPNGGTWFWEYDKAGLLVRRIDPSNRETLFEYNLGKLYKIVDAAGNATHLTYDEQGNLSGIITADGAKTQWTYDKLGHPVTVTDSVGNKQTRIFDLLGRLLQVEEADGNKRILAYDGMGNIIHAMDKHHDIHFKYQGLGRLVCRTEADRKIYFEYDTEENLQAVINEHGFRYRFELDELGEITAEYSFDNTRRLYTRDANGRVTKVERATGLISLYSYDEVGRLTMGSHSDGSQETYRYRGDGELISASNDTCTIKFERDAMGRVIKEWQDDYWIKSKYDLVGLRSGVKSCFGSIQKIERNVMGGVTALHYQDLMANSWETHIKRDQIGLELERELPGGVRNHWQRDKIGRPICHQVLNGNGSGFDVKYNWDVNDRLKRITNSNYGSTVYVHDELGNLASAQYGDGKIDFRLPDEVGNLFHTVNRMDRKYGPAGQLIENRTDKGVITYEYDQEGNLIRKNCPDGVWHYYWNSGGMLACVRRPNGDKVQFEYDPLGRRVSKTFRGRTTRWLYDGNNPIHEWVEGDFPGDTIQPSNSTQSTVKPLIDELVTGNPPTGPPDDQQNRYNDLISAPQDVITWLFDPESFAPAAKIIGTRRLSIITDHLGTAMAMLDEKGHKVWSAEMSVYGELRNIEGDRQACPFRWPGQYEDEETGLYYNRFRYYDNEAGSYIAQDPLRLFGGGGLYTYVHDPNTWTDALGLMPWGDFMNSAEATISAGGVTETFPNVPGGQHAEMNGLTDFERRGLLSGNDVTISNVVGDFNPGGIKPAGICTNCRSDMFDVLQRGGATSVTMPVTVGNRVRGTITIPQENFNRVAAELDEIRRGPGTFRNRSDAAWDALRRNSVPCH